MRHPGGVGVPVGISGVTHFGCVLFTDGGARAGDGRVVPIDISR